MKKILFIILFIPFLGFSQVSHKSNVVETDSLIGRTSSGFNIPYTWGPSQRYFTINDSSAHDWVYARVDERVGVSGDFWKTGEDFTVPQFRQINHSGLYYVHSSGSELTKDQYLEFSSPTNGYFYVDDNTFSLLGTDVGMNGSSSEVNLFAGPVIDRLIYYIRDDSASYVGDKPVTTDRSSFSIATEFITKGFGDNNYWKTSGNTTLDSTGQQIETLGGEFRTRLNIGNADNFGATELVVWNDTASNSSQIGAYTIRHSNISTNFGMPSNTLFNSNNQFEGLGGARKSSQIATTSIGNIYAGKRSPTDPSSAFGALMYLDDYSANWVDGGNNGTITRDRVVPDLGEVEKLLNDTSDVVRNELNARIDTTHREGIGTWKFSSDTIKTTLTNNRWELNWSDPAVADTISINKNADGPFPQDHWTTRLRNIPDSSWILLKKDINNYYGFQVKKPEYNGNIKFYFQIIDRALKGTIQHGDITSLIIDESVRGATGGSSGVTTFEGRSGAVVSQSGDYSLGEISDTDTLLTDSDTTRFMRTDVDFVVANTINMELDYPESFQIINTDSTFGRFGVTNTQTYLRSQNEKGHSLGVANDNISVRNYESGDSTKINFLGSSGVIGKIIASSGHFTFRANVANDLAPIEVADPNNDKHAVTKGYLEQQPSASLTDGNPTDAELNSVFGTVSAGFRATIKDTDGTSLMYMVTYDGTGWWNVSLQASP